MKKQTKEKELNETGEKMINVVKEFVEATKKLEETKVYFDIDNSLDSAIEYLRQSNEELADKLEEIRLASQQDLSKIIIANTSAIYQLLK